MLEDIGCGNKVCRLNKAYGLKQSGRQWHKRLNQELLNLGFTPLNSDPCVYSRSQGGIFMLVIAYVDDILVMSKDKNEITKVGKNLSKIFKIRDLGDVSCCLGIEFVRHENGYSIHQRGFIQDVLARFGMTDCKAVSTPMDVSTKLSRSAFSDDEEQITVSYRELVGSLMYVAMGSRPDIAHVVSYLSCYNDCYQHAHWIAAKRVLRYLKGTLDYAITYRFTGGHPLVGFVDADWGSCPDDRRSYTGYAFILAGALPGSPENRERSHSHPRKLSTWELAMPSKKLRQFLKELGLEDMADVTVLCDNIGAQKLTSNPVFHSRTKHIDIRHHFVREKLESREIKLRHVSTDDMAADVLTKGLGRNKHDKCLGLLGINRLLA